jgi:NAD+ diphosphatase
LTVNAFTYCPACTALLNEQDVQGETRRACSKRCGFVLYDNPTPVVAAVVEHEHKVVLARNRSWPMAFYGLISGFLERGETPEQCALREVKEELGLMGDRALLIGAYAFPQMNQIIIAYHVEARGKVTLGDELTDYRSVALSECQAWSAGTGLALRDWLQGRGYEPAMLDLSDLKKD